MRRVERPVPAPRKKLRVRRPGFFGWLRDVAGNATTETVIMIPVFVAIWGGTVYTHQRYRAAQNMSQYTRAHTWQHAFASCEGDSPSPRTQISERSSSSDSAIGGTISFVFEVLAFVGFSFNEVEGERNVTVDRPSVLGEGTVSMGHNIFMLCNERRQEDSNFFTSAYQLFFP